MSEEKADTYKFVIFRKGDEHILNAKLDMSVDRVFIHKETGVTKALLAFPNEKEYREFLKDLSTIYSVVKINTKRFLF